MNLTLARFLIIAALVGLSGCEQKYTESYYFSHPNTLKTVLRQCQSHGDTPETFDAHCKLAYNTAVKMTRLMQDFVNNQTGFGQRIMHAQIHLVTLSEQLQIAEKARLSTISLLKKQVANAQQHVNNLRAIVGIFVQM